jgi:hypothetical protein
MDTGKHADNREEIADLWVKYEESKEESVLSGNCADGGTVHVGGYTRLF